MIINFRDLGSSGGGSDPRLTSSAFTDVVLNTSASTLDFYNINGDLVEQFDASSLIIDGMVEDVYISGNTLVIEFNTESGKQDINVDLSDIFDPDNYYTSAQTDTLILNAKNDVYASATTYTDNAISGIDLSAAVASANTYTDGEVSALTAHLEDVEQVTASALTSLHTDIVDLSGATANFVTSGDVETQITNKNYITSADTADFITSGYVETAITHMVESEDDSVVNVIKISQNDYDSLSAKSSTTLYVIIS